MFLYKPKTKRISGNPKQEKTQNISEEVYEKFCGKRINAVSFENKKIEKNLFELPDNKELEVLCPSRSDLNCQVVTKIKRIGKSLYYFSEGIWFECLLQISEGESVIKWDNSKFGEIVLTTQRFVFITENENQQQVYDFPLSVIFSVSNTNDALLIGFNPFYSALYEETLSIPVSRSVSESFMNEINRLRFSNGRGEEPSTAFVENPERYDQEKYFDPNSEHFKVFKNEKYELCETYPLCLVVPSKTTDEMIKKCSEFRSKKRIPICTYFNQNTKAAILRCSQPLVAASSYFIGVLKDSTSEEDQQFLSLIRTQGRDEDSILFILDCRPVTNAYANRVNGGGYENTSVYKNTELKFLNIPNIHTVYDCFFKMRNALVKRDLISPQTYYRETSEWLDLLYGLVESVNYAVTLLQSGERILVHCSDGWDRTAQISSLSRIVLLSRYRTAKGFFDLIYQEWISAGHQFQRRLHNKTSENSPVFYQFLEVVATLIRKNPSAFQFDEDLVVKVMEEATCPTTITFVRNCEKERSALNCDKYEDFFTQQLKNFPSDFDHEKLEDVDIKLNADDFIVWKKYYLRETSVVLI